MVVMGVTDVTDIDADMAGETKQPCCKSVSANKKSAPAFGADPRIGRAGGI